MANSFINKKADLTTTDLTTLYTVPTAKTAVVKSILVSEDAGSGANITITLVDSASNIFSLFKSKTISSNTTTELLTQPLVMEESEILKVQVIIQVFCLPYFKLNYNYDDIKNART
jgi:hypothetical protein